MYKLKKEDVKQASLVISAAFFDDPIWMTFFPVDEIRRLFMPCMNEFMLEMGLKIGNVVSSSEKLEGIAVWFPEKTANFGFRHIISNGLFFKVMKIMKKYKKEMLDMQKSLKILEKDRKRIMKGRNYMYLALIGIAPEHQGKGQGGKILKGLFEESRQQQKPIYLETETENNVEIYKHYGFKVVNERDYRDRGFYIWQMIREPEV